MAVRKEKGSKYSQTAHKKDVLDTKRQISELSSNLTEMKSIIAGFSDKHQGTSSSESNSGQEAPVSGDTENSFGGRPSKRTNE